VPVRGPEQTDRKDALKPAFSVPAGTAGGKVHIEAILHYRKIDQFLLNYALGEKSGVTAPVVDVASATASVCVVSSGGSNK
jgi:hypothetical protein